MRSVMPPWPSRSYDGNGSSSEEGDDDASDNDQDRALFQSKGRKADVLNGEREKAHSAQIGLGLLKQEQKQDPGLTPGKRLAPEHGKDL
jgi:hypothetical protein